MQQRYEPHHKLGATHLLLQTSMYRQTMRARIMKRGEHVHASHFFGQLFMTMI
jgi:hypothetical protein